MLIKIKPLSVNKCWQGKRFKTKDYKSYEQELMLKLGGNIIVSKNDKIVLTVIFGLSNMQSDIDNPLKPFLDILQKRYGFNDKQIMQLHILKKKAEKGEEYIDFMVEVL